MCSSFLIIFDATVTIKRFFLTLQSLLLLLSTVSSFAPMIGTKGRSRSRVPLLMSSFEHADLIRFTTPSPSEAESLGIREWPQQARSKGSFEEGVQEGQTLVRYVLDGEANVIVVKTKNTPKEERSSMRPGSLLEVRGEAKLRWQVESEEVILLTPGFEQIGLFAGVVIGLVMVMGALIASN